MTKSQNPYAKTRDDHQTETSEDYVEAIYRETADQLFDFTQGCDTIPGVKTVALSRALGVAQPTVTKILTRLERDGLVCIHPRQHVHLTESGYELARASLARHELVVQFLTRLGVSAQQAELDAEGVEHHLSQESLTAMQKFLSR